LVYWVSYFQFILHFPILSTWSFQPVTGNFTTFQYSIIPVLTIPLLPLNVL
jgi:hypothetical protein